jgi:protease-4
MGSILTKCFRAVLSFIKEVLAIYLAIIFIAITLITVIFFLLMKDKNDLVPTKTTPSPIVMIHFDHPIVEREAESSLIFSDVGLFPNLHQMGLHNLLDVIKKATHDPTVHTLYLKFSKFSVGQASLQDLYMALLEFKKKGKWIYSYGENFSKEAFALASLSHKIFIYPFGQIEFQGLSMAMPFFRPLLSKLKIKPYIFKAGDYKSAVEPFILDEMSSFSRKQNQVLIDELWESYLIKVEHNRKLPRKQINQILEQNPSIEASLALKERWVDQLSSETEVMTFLQKKWPSGKDKKEIPTGEVVKGDKKRVSPTQKLSDFMKESVVHWRQYLFLDRMKTLSKSKNEKLPLIAQILIQGEIVDGLSREGQTGSESIIKSLRQIQDDDRVKGVVIRINSPGGSALASDVIWQEIQAVRKKKPVWASMGDVAASGGYYVASACEKIYARPATITGSIGVFGLLFSAKDFSKEFAHVHWDSVSTGRFSQVGMPYRDLDPQEAKIIQSQVELTYQRFLDRVVLGRKTPFTHIFQGDKAHLWPEQIASGRVWTGFDAQKWGLVDVLKGPTEIIQDLSSTLKLKKDGFEVVDYPRDDDRFQQIFSLFKMDLTRFMAQNNLVNVFLSPFFQGFLEKTNGFLQLLQTEEGRHHLQGKPMGRIWISIH